MLVAIVAFGFSRAASELALELIPDAMQRTGGERNIMALDVGLGEELVEKDAVVAVGIAIREMYPVTRFYPA